MVSYEEGIMELTFAKPQVTRRASVKRGPLYKLLEQLATFTVEAGGTDKLPEGGWVDPTGNDELKSILHEADQRRARSNAWALNKGKIRAVRAIESEFGGYFDATSQQDGTKHGVRDEKGRELTGAYLIVRFVTRDSDEYDEDVATVHAAEDVADSDNGDTAPEPVATDEGTDEPADDDDGTDE